MKTVIVLSGKKGTGKDTSFELIKANFRCGDCKGTGAADGGFLSFDGTSRPCKRCCFSGVIGHTKYIKGMSFADPLKSICQVAFGLTKKQCYGGSKERMSYSNIKWDDISIDYHRLRGDNHEEYLTAREVLQFVGTNVMRDFYPKMWCRAAASSAMTSSSNFVVLTDARFPDEIEEFQALADDGKIKLIVIRLYRDSAPKDTHRSEMALDRWDELHRFQHSVFNNGTIGELSSMLRRILIEEKAL